MNVTVIGGGVVGLCVAWELQRAGAAVLLLDDSGPDTLNASTVAAGMIAPASEAAFDEPVPGRAAMLLAARDLWLETPAAGRLQRCGALILADPKQADGLPDAAEALGREGVGFERLPHAQARDRAPELATGGEEVLFTADDWRIEVGPALNDLRRAFRAAGGRVRREQAAAAVAEPGRAVVICAGWGSRSFARSAPELDVLTPIKGQLLRYPGVPPFSGPVLRRGGLYAAPGAAGVLVGASMEAGSEDLAPSPSVTASLAAAAREILPHLAEVAPVSAVGVRAATPDGAPLVGRSRGGLHLATGFRRNGWLLAPLAARIVADQLSGRDPGEWARAMRPDRFGL